MLGRNLLKLRRERRQQKLGSKFESRSRTFAIAISLLPVAGLFFFSYALINRSVEKWFTLPTNKILEAEECFVLAFSIAKPSAPYNGRRYGGHSLCSVCHPDLDGL